MEKIICAAVKISNQVFMGHRHCHALTAMHDKLSWELSRKQINELFIKQGFVTSENRFVDREEALRIAIASGQVHESRIRSGELYSEDLY